MRPCVLHQLIATRSCTNANCGLSVRAQFHRNSKIQVVLRAPHPRFSDQLATNRQDELYTASLFLVRNLIVPGTQQLFLTRVKNPCTLIIVVLFLLPHKLLDKSLPLHTRHFQHLVFTFDTDEFGSCDSVNVVVA